MPNWCSNRLIVKGMTIEEFKSLYYGEENCFSFDKVIPIGEWDYQNAVNAWGTKWNAAEQESYNEDENGFILDFQSAWSPPDPVVNKLNENHSDASFKLLYYEPGCDFCGVNSITGDYTYSFMDGVGDFWDEDLKSYIEQERKWFEEAIDWDEYYEEAKKGKKAEQVEVKHESYLTGCLSEEEE